MANGHGGARPGAGRKPDSFQVLWNAAAKKVVTAAQMENLVRSTLETALTGDVSAQKLMYDRLLGKVPDKVEMTGEEGGPLTVKIVFEERSLTGD